MPRKRENKKKNRSNVFLYPTRKRKFQKNSKKIQKIKKKNIMASFQAKIGCERLRKREKKKKNHFDGCPPDP